VGDGKGESGKLGLNNVSGGVFGERITLTKRGCKRKNGNM